MLSLVLKFVIYKIWFFVVVEMFILVFFLFVVWYCFLIDIIIVLVFVFIGGFIIGVMYVNMLVIYFEIEELKFREFVLGYVFVVIGVGVIIVGFLGLFFEFWLCYYCLSVEINGSFCFI